MGHRPRRAASSDAYTRPFFWLLLLCAIPIVISQADNQNTDASPVPSQDPPAVPASPPVIPCKAKRPFLCYVYQALDQPFPDWLQQTEQKCERCDSDKVCALGSPIGGHGNGRRLTVHLNCAPPFCNEENDMSEGTDCIKAVNFDGDQRADLLESHQACYCEHWDPVATTRTVAAVLAILYCFGRTVALPFLRPYEGIDVSLELQTVDGNWLDAFDERITAKRKWRKLGRKIRFAETGHVALHAYPETLPARDAIPPKDATVAGTPQQATNSTSADTSADKNTVSGEVKAALNDPVAVARSIMRRLANAKSICPRPDGRKDTPNFLIDELLVMFKHAKEIVAKQRGVVHISGPVWFVGDLMGDVFYLCGSYEADQKGFPIKGCTGDNRDGLIKEIVEFLPCLPLYAIIDGRILAMHGGISPELKSGDLRRGFDPTGGRSQELRLASLTSDPNFLVKEYANKKGPGYVYGFDAVNAARKALGVDFIIRAHQATNVGVRFFGEWLLSLYSQVEQRDADEREQPLGAVLQYDVTSSFTAIHFLKLGRKIDTAGVFMQEFDYLACRDRAFSEAGVMAGAVSPPKPQPKPSQELPSAPEEEPEECENPRAFLCYVYEALDQPFPDWLQQTEQKCERCESPEVCKIGAVIAGHLDDDHDHNRLSVYDECHPPFCKDEQDMSEDTKCIKAVNFDGDKRDAGGVVTLLAVLVPAGFLYHKKRSSRLGALPLPEVQKAESIELRDEDTEGNWMVDFDRVISGDPATVQPGVLHFAKEGHIALQTKQKETQNTPSPLQEIKCQQPDDPVAIAKNMIQVLGGADLYLQANIGQIFYLFGTLERMLEETGAKYIDEDEAEGTAGDRQIVMKKAVDLFVGSMPLYATVDGRLLAMSGGLCPELTPKDIRDGFDPTDYRKARLRSGTSCSDPHWLTARYARKPCRDFIGYLFGQAPITEILAQLGMDFIIRGRQIDNSSSKMGAVLQYDGATRLTTIRFIHGHYYKDRDEFVNAFDSSAADKDIFATCPIGVSSKNAANSSEWPPEKSESNESKPEGVPK
ncbi:unnamed protein product, partial [Mesorhabditis spiculigera]